MKEIIMEPLVGVGPVKIGMSRGQVRSEIAVEPSPFKKTPDSEHETDAFDEEGMHVYYTGDDSVVEFVELFEAESVALIYKGLDLLRSPGRMVLEHLSAGDKPIEEELGAYVFHGLEVSLWRESPDQEDCFEAIGVGCKGYFSHSVQT